MPTPVTKKLGRIMDFAVFDGGTKISEHASLSAAKKKAHLNPMRYHVRQWIDKHWRQVPN